MHQKLLPLIRRRFGLKTIQLGCFDSLSICLALGQNIRKDQVALLYPDVPASDVEVVLIIF